MRKKRAGAGSTILLAAFLCGCVAGTSPLHAAETAPADPAAQIARGKTLFISYGCGWCHEGGGRKAGRCPQLMGTERDDNFILSMARVDCDIVFDSIVDRETAEDAHLRLSRPYTTSGVAIALRPGLDGIKGFSDLKKEQRVAAIGGSLARVQLGQKGLQTIPFTFEDEMLEALGKGELDAALATPATIGYYNLLHKDAPVTLVQDYESMPELRWEIAVGMRKADDALVAAVNTALDHMLADGTVSRIYAGYGIEQSPPTTP